MKIEYYEKAFGMKFPLHEKPVEQTIQNLMEANGSWDDLEYIASHKKNNATFYITSSPTIKEEFYHADKIPPKNIGQLVLYVNYKTTSAIIGIRYPQSQPELKKNIKEFKDVVGKLNTATILDSIKQQKKKWPVLVSEKVD